MANEEVLELQIRDNAGTAAASLLSLSTALERVKEAVGKGLRLKGVATQLETLKNAVNSGLNEESVARFERLANVLEKLKAVGGIKVTGIKNIASQMNVAESMSEAKEQAQDTAESIANAVDRGMEQVDSRTGEVANTVKANFGGIKTWFNDVVNGFRDIKQEGQSTSGTWNFFNNLGEGIQSAREKIGGLVSDFSRILKYRMIRSVIKQITEAFTTGIKNVYQYSKAIGGEFAPAMDDAASVLLQFKNSIGAAVAPLIQQLIPYLKIVVNALMEAINYFNQFMALLRGQSTWTKAIYKATDAFEDQSKKAKSSGKAIKDLLADWDELNIIQSESGGGGGGSAAKAVEDYTKMFEEESKFDNWLSGHFKDVLDMIKMAGAALLGWKLSKHFTGILGKLFRLVAGGALVALGVKLSFESGFDAGLNGFNTGNILGMIGGALAAGLGGYLITSAVGLGGGIGLAIGIGVGIVASLYGYIKGRQDLTDKNKWGNLTMTQQQIEEFVKKQFTFDVASEITVLDGAIANTQQARTNLNQKITEFKDSLQSANVEAKINIDSDKASTSIIAAAESGKEAIKSVNELVNASGEGLNIILKTFSFTNEAGEDISKELLESVKLDNKTVTEYFTGIGDQIAALIEQGEHEHWTNADTKQAVLDLLEREQKILEEANKYKADVQLNAKIRAGYSSVVDRDTAKSILEQQKQELKNYETTANELFNEQAASYSELAGLAYAAAKDAEEQGDFVNAEALKEAGDRYAERATEILGDAQKKIDAKLSETKANMAKDWANTLIPVYGTDFQNSLNKHMPGMKNQLGYIINSLTEKGEYAEAGSALKGFLTTYFTENDPNGVVSYVLNDLQGNVFDLLTDEMKKQLRDNLLSMTKGDTNIAAEIFKSAFNLTDEDLDDIFNIAPISEEDLEVIEDVDLDLNANIHLETDAEKFRQQLQEELEYAVWDGVLTVDEEEALRRRFSDALFEEALDQMDIHTDEFGNVSGASRLGNRQLASTGYYVGGAGVNTNINGTGNEPESEPLTVNDIEAGVRGGNEPLNGSLTQILDKLTAIGNKQWTVNVYPSSGWGFNNRQSETIMNKVIG